VRGSSKRSGGWLVQVFPALFSRACETTASKWAWCRVVVEGHGGIQLLAGTLGVSSGFVRERRGAWIAEAVPVEALRVRDTREPWKGREGSCCTGMRARVSL